MKAGLGGGCAGTGSSGGGGALVTVTVSDGVSALLSGFVPGLGWGRSGESKLVRAIANPPTTTSAITASRPATGRGTRCHGATSSAGSGCSVSSAGPVCSEPYGLGAG